MHLPVHYRDHVKWLGAIGAYSTEMGESAHREQLKDAYQHSNRKNYTDQIIAYYTRISALRMRELNIKQWIEESGSKQDISCIPYIQCSSGMGAIFSKKSAYILNRHREKS